MSHKYEEIGGFDKKIIRQNFSKAAANYENYAIVQKAAAQKLAQLAEPFIKKNSAILDLGSGTSFVSQALKVLPNQNIKIFETDLSFEMLKYWQDRDSNFFLVQLDFENLPFKNNSFDVLISSFSLQWLQDFDKSFLNFFSLLKPGGILAFCLPTEQSLKELKEANVFNFNALPKVSNLKLSLNKAGFKEFFFGEEIFTQNFENGLEALKSIKKIGGNYFSGTRNLINKTKLRQFDNFCLKNCNTVNRNIEVSWAASYFILQK